MAPCVSLVVHNEVVSPRRCESDPSITQTLGVVPPETSTIDDYLPDETEYPHLADFVRSGGRLEIGESREMGSLARLYIERTVINVVTMKYSNLAHVLLEMDLKAKEYIEKNW